MATGTSSHLLFFLSPSLNYFPTRAAMSFSSPLRYDDGAFAEKGFQDSDVHLPRGACIVWKTPICPRAPFIGCLISLARARWHGVYAVAKRTSGQRLCPVHSFIC